MPSSKPRYFSYSYPGELGTQEIPGVIEFFPRQVEFGATKTVKNPASGGIGGLGVPNIPNLPAPGVNSIVDKIKNQLPGNIGKLKSVVSGMKMQTGRDSVKTYGHISLPMPQNLLAVQSANYSQANIGATGAAAVALGTSSGRDEQISGIKKLLAGAATDLIGAAGNVVQVATGQVTNPFSFTLFQGMTHRTFNYSFQFAPKDPMESELIKKICDSFMYYQLPARDPAGEFQFVEIPLQWDINYKWYGGENKFLESPNRSVLTSVNVTYGAAGGAHRHTDGSPMDVNLDIVYTEVEPLFRDSFGGGVLNADLKGAGQTVGGSNRGLAGNTGSTPFRAPDGTGTP